MGSDFLGLASVLFYLRRWGRFERVVGCKRAHTRVEGTWVGKSYIEKDRGREKQRGIEGKKKELKHEVKFYRRVEMGCHGNEPNIHPAPGGRVEKKGRKNEEK